MAVAIGRRPLPLGTPDTSDHDRLAAGPWARAAADGFQGACFLRDVSGLLEAADERGQLVSGTAHDREQVLDEAGHGAGMSAQHEHKAYDDNPADSPAHGYRSCDAGCIPLPIAFRVTVTTARCSLLAPVAFALESKLMRATYPHAPSAGMPVADRGHAGQGQPDGRW